MDKKKKMFYGWPLIFILGFILFCSTSALMPIASIINPMMLADPNLGLTGTSLGMGFTVLVLMLGLPSPLIGQLIAKKGVRLCMTIGAVIMIIGALGMIFVVKSAIGYIICFGCVIGIGAAMAGTMPAQTTAGNWFARKRGLAMSIMMTIGALASIILPLVVEAVVSATGGAWQSGWWLFFAFGVIIIPLALFLVKKRPADIGQEPDGIDSTDGSAEKKKPVRVYQAKEDISHRMTLKSPFFWLICLAATGAYCGYSIASTQGMIHFTALGFEPTEIVGAVSTMGAASLIGRFAIGALADRLEPIRLICLCLVTIAVGVFIGSGARDITLVYVFYILVGLGFGSVNGNTAITIANYFGLTAYAKNLGILMIFQTVISSAVPLLSGSIYDATGDCTLAFYIVGGFAIVSAIAALLVKIPKKTTVE